MMNAEEFPVVLFSSQDGDVRVNAVLRDRTLWLTQKSMAGLFGVKSQAITKHLKNIYATGELQIAATCSKMEQVQSEGGRNVAREMVFYNLDAIIAVGYRVNSYLATQFRIWATKVLTEYITKGFVLDDNRLKKGGNPFGEDYFRELLERRPFHPRKRAAHLAADHGHIRRMFHRLRPECAYNPRLLCDGAEQIPLRDYRRDSGRNRIFPGGCRKGTHGAQDMEERAGRTSPQERCNHCEELSVSRTGQRT